ncbi:MAG: hypothetical protein JST22_03935 [Bacteroidetes bacterium]|nr:hypothetical protein [Bacteroidota bacterium]
MNASNWLSAEPMIGEMDEREIAAYLDAVIGPEGTAGEITGIERGISAATFGILDGVRERPWLSTSHVFGYMAPAGTGGPAEIIPAGSVVPDRTLIQQQLRITLDAVRAASYPGRGPRTVLVHVVAENVAGNGAGSAEFSRRFTIGDRDSAAVSGLPVFNRLPVQSAGVLLTCAAVSVGNHADDQLLALLDGDVFKAGLDLATIAGPALALVTTFVAGITRAVLRGRRNAMIQRFDLGLDLSAIATRMKLAEGSYVALQLPHEQQAGWDWSRWRYDPATARIVARDATRRTLDLNYLVFGISRSHCEPGEVPTAYAGAT